MIDLTCESNGVCFKCHPENNFPDLNFVTKKKKKKYLGIYTKKEKKVLSQAFLC